MNQEQMIERWLPEIEMNGKDYLKKGTVFARPAKIGEKIITITSDGKETENTAGENCFVVKNPTGEEYILKGETFSKRYDKYKDCNTPSDPVWEMYNPKGKCRAIVWTGEEINFIASWNEEMVIKPGDMLCTPLPDKKEIYRIAANEFSHTYTEIFQ